MRIVYEVIGMNSPRHSRIEKRRYFAELACNLLASRVDFLRVLILHWNMNMNWY
jgi:hypothetical protein